MKRAEVIGSIFRRNGRVVVDEFAKVQQLATMVGNMKQLFGHFVDAIWVCFEKIREKKT
jgi:hypothetical protein